MNAAPATHGREDQIPFSDPAVVPMADAIAAGDVAAIRNLAASTDLSAQGQDGVTLLEWAIWTKQPESLAALLDAGADASQPGMDQETVAHMAAMVEPPEYLKVLIEHAAPIDIANPRTGWTPLFRAVEAQRDTHIRMLIDAKADVQHADQTGNTVLHRAAQAGNGRWVLEFLEHGVDPNARNAQDSTFQPYFFMTQERLLNAEARQQRKAVEAWLAARGLARE